MIASGNFPKDLQGGKKRKRAKPRSSGKRLKKVIRGGFEPPKPKRKQKRGKKKRG